MYFLFHIAPPSYVCMCFVLLQHGADYTEGIPPLTLSSGKGGATLAVSEPWLQQLEARYQSSSASTELRPKSGSSCRLASGNAVLHWLLDFDCQPDSACTLTLPGNDSTEALATERYTVLCWSPHVTQVVDTNGIRPCALPEMTSALHLCKQLVSATCYL